MSILLDTSQPLGIRIGRRVRELRSKGGISLDALAERSGVSRSMISLIERAESSPTAALLERLASGLGVALASLFDAPDGDRSGPLVRRDAQPQWRDPASGYLRRNVSPREDGEGEPTVQIVEVEFPAGARVAFENGASGVQFRQHVWLLEGAIDITVGAERHHLRAGDCLAMGLDRATMFHNPTKDPARYAVVITRVGVGRARR